MKKYILGLASLFLALSFTSCKKDILDIDDIGNSSSSSNIPRIKTTIDSGMISYNGNDHTYYLLGGNEIKSKSDFYYNQEGKVISTYTIYNPGSSQNISEYTIDVDFFGNDVKTTSVHSDGDVAEIYYYCNKKDVCDSISYYQKFVHTSGVSEYFSKDLIFYKSDGSGYQTISFGVMMRDGDTNYTYSDTSFVSFTNTPLPQHEAVVMSDIQIPEYYTNTNIYLSRPKSLNPDQEATQTFFVERQYAVDFLGPDSLTYEPIYETNFSKWTDFSYIFDDSNKLVKIVSETNDGLRATKSIEYYENQF